MNKKSNELQDDNDFVNFELMTSSMNISSNKPHIELDSNNSNMNPRKNIQSDQDLISTTPSYLISGTIPSNKNYKEDNLNKNINTNSIHSFKNNDINPENNNTKDINNNSNISYNSNSKYSIKQNSKNIFDAKIFSDDDMSLNKSNKFINQNSNQNININMNNIDNSSNNSLLLSLNIKEINNEDTNYNDSNLANDIKKILPNDIYNNLNSSQNHLITKIIYIFIR